MMAWEREIALQACFFFVMYEHALGDIYFTYVAIKLLAQRSLPRHLGELKCRLIKLCLSVSLHCIASLFEPLFHCSIV